MCGLTYVFSLEGTSDLGQLIRGSLQEMAGCPLRWTPCAKDCQSATSEGLANGTLPLATTSPAAQPWQHHDAPTAACNLSQHLLFLGSQILSTKMFAHFGLAFGRCLRGRANKASMFRIHLTVATFIYDPFVLLFVWLSLRSCPFIDHPCCGETRMDGCLFGLAFVLGLCFALGFLQASLGSKVFSALQGEGSPFHIRLNKNGSLGFVFGGSSKTGTEP